MLVDHVHLSQMYEDKTNFYRKLDAICDSIHDFKSMQDTLMNRNKGEDLYTYEKPDFNDFTRTINPHVLDMDDMDFRSRSRSNSPEQHLSGQVPIETLFGSKIPDSLFPSPL
jgi:hypothetical protein